MPLTKLSTVPAAILAAFAPELPVALLWPDDDAVPPLLVLPAVVLRESELLACERPWFAASEKLEPEEAGASFPIACANELSPVATPAVPAPDWPERKSLELPPDDSSNALLFEMAAISACTPPPTLAAAPINALPAVDTAAAVIAAPAMTEPAPNPFPSAPVPPPIARPPTNPGSLFTRTSSTTDMTRITPSSRSSSPDIFKWYASRNDLPMPTSSTIVSN